MRIYISSYKKIISSIIFMCAFSGQLQAEVPVGDPVKLVEYVTSSVMDELKANKDKLNTDSSIIYNLVDDLVLPYVDFVEISKWIAGKSAWYSADGKTQTNFIKEIKVLLLRTYAIALNQYTNETMEVYPLQSSASKRRVQVLSKIVRSNKEDIRINYRLISQDSKWKLYDVIIEGISLLKGYQAQFSDDIKKHGLAHVTKQIHEHNQEKK